MNSEDALQMAIKERNDFREELRDVLIAIDSVLEYDEPHRVARLMNTVEPLLVREFKGASGWGSELAARGFKVRGEAPPTKPSPEFLTQLVELARRYGWSGDYTEVASFVQWCYDEAGLPPPSKRMLEPYDA